jgi:hypothetical protein
MLLATRVVPWDWQMTASRLSPLALAHSIISDISERSFLNPGRHWRHRAVPTA